MIIIEKSWAVYIHTNKINGKKYVGMTSNIKSRFSGNGRNYLHKNKKGEYSQPLFARAILKYGWENFSHEIVEENLSLENANKLEKELIIKYDTQNTKKGYNIREGGSHGKLGEKTKEKLSKNMMGKYVGEKNPFFGKKHTEETKNIIKQKRLNKLKEKTEEEKREYANKMNEGKAKKRVIKENKILELKNKLELENDEEKKEEIKKELDSFKIKRKPLSEETKKKISKSNKDFFSKHQHQMIGKPKSEETKQKLREKMLGRIMDENWRRKIGEGHSPYIYICLETKKEYYSSAEAMRQTGIHKSSIQNAANGKQKTAGGYHWEKKLK